jgi:hypothetical protein
MATSVPSTTRSKVRSGIEARTATLALPETTIDWVIARATS